MFSAIPPPFVLQSNAGEYVKTARNKESVATQTGGLDMQSPHPKHHKFVFTDPVAFRYLEEDPSTVVLHRHLVLQGYEVYIVEQWTCSRIHPTFVITTYTGDPLHTVVVGVLSIPTDESTWSPRLQLYFKAVMQYHARKIETPLGSLMVTDLGGFPSSLTVISVPDGDVNKHREDFIVNENLKRLGCAGRAGLKLQYPPAATEAKFHQLYRTSERVPLYNAVTALIKLCQTALMMFDKLAPEYVDGLLCDVTEAAITDWWADIGMDLYDIDLDNGVVGPTAVAALLGTLLGARNRLHAYGAPVGKDAFDIVNLKRGIGSFQKSEKLKRTRRLDRQTLEKLHRVTAKAASSDKWAGAVRTTVAELGGKGGEMVMGMVGGRGKGGIADIETLDMDTFASLVTGEKAKWLWRGKPRKSSHDNGFTNVRGASDMMFTRNDQGGYIWTSRKRRSNELLGADRFLQGPEHSWNGFDSSSGQEDKDHVISRITRKKVSGRVSDARAGFDRFKDAVGLQGRRSHSHKHAKMSSADLPEDSETDRDEAEPGILTSQGQIHGDDEPAAILPPESDRKVPPEINIETVSSGDDEDLPPEESMQGARSDDEGYDLDLYGTVSNEPSNEEEPMPEQVAISLRRPQSCIELGRPYNWRQRDDYWPRRLSFSNVEDVIIGWEGFQAPQEKANAGLEEAILEEDILASDARDVSCQIVELNQTIVPWVERQVESVEEIMRILYDRQGKLGTYYLDRLKEYERMKQISSDLLEEEHSCFNDQIKKVELLGAKLDYEVDALESKIKDFEDGLEEFEEHVVMIETRVQALVDQGEVAKSSSWFSWIGRFVSSLIGHEAM